MKLFIKDIPGLVLPKQANEGEDAAYDIVATTRPMITGDHIERSMDHMPLWRRVAFIEYGTNLFVAPDIEQVKIVDGSQVIDTMIKGKASRVTELTWKQLGITYHTQLYPRSSISNYNLVLANSVATIDGGYRNQIFCRFKYIFQPEDLVTVMEESIRIYGMVNNDHIYQQGDKIVQIKATRNVKIEFVKVADLPTSQRNTGGFGSSGK